MYGFITGVGGLFTILSFRVKKGICVDGQKQVNLFTQTKLIYDFYDFLNVF